MTTKTTIYTVPKFSVVKNGDYAPIALRVDGSPPATQVRAFLEKMAAYFRAG